MKTVETQLLDLVTQLNEKTSLVVIDNTYLTWLEDIEFDYMRHRCYIPYMAYSLYNQNVKRDIDRNQGYNHIDYIEKPDGDIGNNDNNSGAFKDNHIIQYARIRYNFEYLTRDIQIGDSLIIFDLDSNEFCRYIIKSWINHPAESRVDIFSLKMLYELYKGYSFYDMETEFSRHESGYTYINFNGKAFKNTENTLRQSFGLKTWKELPIENDHRDVRVYKYFDYINRVGQDSIQTFGEKLFKYRRLAFESYLFCHIMQRSVPADYIDEWDKLGKSLYYIKTGDKHLPLFVKAEWKLDNELASNQTWRRYSKP